MIPEQEMQEVAEYVKANSASEQTILALRKAYSDRHFSFCSEDDVNSGEPVVENELFALYLVDASEACLKLTNNSEVATGYLIAEAVGD